MAGVRMDIKRELLLWAIEKSGKSFREIGDKFPLDHWLTDERKPTFNQIVNLSKFLSIPFGYFVLEHPPKEDETLMEYRTIMTKGVEGPSRELMDTIHDMKMKQDWMRNYLLDNGYEKLKFIGTQSTEGKVNVSKIAANIRAELSINEQWYTEIGNRSDAFKYFRNKATEAGILVFQNGVTLNNTHRPLNLEEFRAFILIDDYAPLIFLNAKDTINGKTFSLLHEIVHIWFGENSLYNDFSYHKEEPNAKDIEIYCNAIAAEILVPSNRFLEKWNQIGNSDIEEIANHFKVSNIVAARRAFDHQKVSKHEYEEVVNDTLQRINQLEQKKKSTGGGDYYITINSRLDRRFFNALADQTREGNTLNTTAYRLTGLNRKTFENMIQKTEGRG